MKPKGKKPNSSSKESLRSKNLVSLWWKLSINERKAHFHAITIDLLAPFLFKQKIVRNPYCMSWGSEFDLYDCGKDSNGNINNDGIMIMEVIEEAVDTLKENLSKFDSSKYLDKMVISMEMIRNYRSDLKVDPTLKITPSFTRVLGILKGQDWFTYFRQRMVESDGLAAQRRDAALLISSMQVCAYINSLNDGDKPLETLDALSSLNDAKILEEKEKGNTFFKNQNYEQAIKIYSRLLDKRPFSHLIYSNRAECYLKTRHFRLALVDARRTITLDPTSEKGYYRYCRALEQIGWYHEASQALKAALKVCPSSVHLETSQSRIKKRMAELKSRKLGLTQELRLAIAKQPRLGILDAVQGFSGFLSDEPPDLVSCSSGDESASSSESELSDGIFSEDEYDEDMKEEITDSANGVSDSDDFCDTNEQDESCKPLKNAKDSQIMNRKNARQPKGKAVSDAKERTKAVNVQDNGSLWELKDEMERGTKLFLTEKYDEASFFFNLVINLIKSGKNFSLDREEQVVLIYAYGMCSFLSGSPSDLEAARAQFDRIIADFSDVNFPLVHYIYGRIYEKQSRFVEMQSSLNKALEIIKESGVAIRKWPGSQHIIEETRPDELEKRIEKLLDSIVCDTHADAICRFEECSMNRRQIFLNELDAKGFFRIKCNEFCVIEYHSVCWQQFKQSLSFKTDAPLKGLLNQKCFTPDCSGFLSYICFTSLSKDSAIRNVEHKVDPIKKQQKEVKKIDKCKQTKGSGRKRLKKKKGLKAEKEQEASNTLNPENTVVPESKKNELSAVEIGSRTDSNTKMVDVNHKLEIEAFDYAQDPTIPSWILDPTFYPTKIHPQDSGLFILDDKSSYEDLWQTPKKVKKKNKKKSSNALDVISSNSELDPVQFPASTCCSLEPMVDDIPESMRDTVTEHLHSLFADLLVSKGHMNVKSDEDVLDLLNILDNFSASIVNSWGGLGNFLAISPTFTFDPDDRDIVYLTKEADIYLLSKKETYAQKAASVKKRGKFQNSSSNLSKDITLGKNDAINRNTQNHISQADPQSSENSSKKDSSGTKAGKLPTASSDLLLSLKDSKGAKAKQQAVLWNETEKQRGVPDEVFQPRSSPIINSSSKSTFANSLQNAVDKFKVRSEESPDKIGDKGKKLQLSDPSLQPVKWMTCECYKNVKEKRDIAVMTEFEDKHFKMLYESEVAERRKLLEKYVETMDSLEQTKNKLKIEKESSASRVMELRASLEGMRNKLTKECQSKESMQKKWQQEKEKMKGTIQSLEEKLKRFDEISKEELREKQNDVNRAIEKIGEMKLNEERIRAENEGIVNKLSSCVTEQTKRAQNVEILLLKERKEEIRKRFQGMIEHAQRTIYIINHSPFLEPNVNKLELLRLWETYYETIFSNLRKCMVKYDDTIASLEGGVPLSKTEPINFPANPAAPPQPRLNFSPNMAGQPSHRMQLMENIPPYMDMLQPRMAAPIIAIPQPNSSTQDLGKHLHPNGGLLAQATVLGDEKPNTPSRSKEAGVASSVPISTSNLVNPAESMLPVGEEMQMPRTESSREVVINPKSSNRGAAKSSSFEKIMMKLNMQFPKHSKDDLIKCLRDFREQRNNTLSGLTVDDIIAGVSKLVRESYSPADKKPLKSSREQVVKSKVDSMLFGCEEPCVICHEDMIHVNKTTQLQCYHIFHTECIQRWLKQQRTCPTCRDHALLPDEFPALH